MSKKKWTVYFHTNNINNKVYVGITSRNVKERWGKQGHEYLRKSKKGEYFQSKFARAILAYGWDNFNHIIFAENLSKEDAYFLEITLIAFFDSINNGYNICRGGGGTLGIGVSEEERKRRSIAFKGKHFSKDTEFKKGHTFSDDVLRKMSQAKKGKSSWNKGLKGYNSGDKNPMKRPEVAAKFKGANNKTAKRVHQFDLEGNFIKEWDYLSQIYEQLGYNIPNISKCCKGAIKSAYGYRWIYPAS